MKTFHGATEHEIMRCIGDGNQISGVLLAMLERQKAALASAERSSALKANPPVTTSANAASTAPSGFATRLSHWLGARLVSVGHRLENSAT